MKKVNINRLLLWRILIGVFTLLITYFHFTTPPDEGHIHLILMQFYLVPILIGAIQFGVLGGFGTALVISMIVAPHIIFQWVGGAQHHFLGYLQIVIFNTIGYFTGLKSQHERNTRDNLRQTAEELAQTLERFEKQSIEMSEMEEQLRHSERLSVIGELMASLAHEIRNPLASIRGSVEILSKELSEQEKRGEFFQILVDETDRMSGVVENYLALARRRKGADIEYNAAEIIRNACQLLKSRAKKDRITIEYTPQNSIAMILGDPNDLRQVMVNIILNAIQAMQDPGKITISTSIQGHHDNESSNKAAEPENKVLEICIEDEGPGIQNKKLTNIFKPFYSTKAQGTGLGLSIVKRIVDSRHWQIQARNKTLTGASFILKIPVQEHQFLKKHEI